jgi:hypothetical protein
VLFWKSGTVCCAEMTIDSDIRLCTKPPSSVLR